MSRKILYIFTFLLTGICASHAQISDYDDGFTITDNTFNPNRNAADSLNASHKEVPKGLRVWTIDNRFGDRTEQQPDTLQHLFMNTIFTTGKYGEYNTTGNLGAPRISRIATDRNYTSSFDMLEPYGFFITPPSDLRFTNTLSPITNLTFNTCGDRTDGEDHLKALFATNINKEAGIGFKFDYVYGRGYYQNQSTALFDYTMWGSYIGERYQAHLSMSFDHMKTTENGGITNDDYITHPEATTETYSTSEIPVLLSNNWNRTNAFHATLSHRYNIGFYKKVPMTEQEIEARRFAIRAEKEKAEKEKLNQKNAIEKKVNRPNTMTSGRPADAAVVGDLPTDSIKEVIKRIAEQKRLEKDSLLAQADTTAVDTSWTKDEYVPVTSFIHTMKLDNYRRTYIAYTSPTDLYLNKYAFGGYETAGDSIYDKTTHFNLRNVFAISLLEGFNKYIPMGAKVFAAHDFRRYSLPTLGSEAMESFIENNFGIGGQLIKSTGNTLHYQLTGEFTVVGSNIGDILIDGDGELNLKLSKRDSVNIALKAFYHLTDPSFYKRVYHSKHFWWDKDGMAKQMQTHIEGTFSVSRTHTSLRAAYDNFQNLSYLGVSNNRNSDGGVTDYTVNSRQSSKNISLFTLELQQNFRLGILNWENRITYQKSTDDDILPVPALNVWSNLYLNFRIARVLGVHFGVDARYFTEYYAPEYVPQLSQYAVQENESVKTKIGNYPIVNVYCNFRLKQCRFFVMMSHINAGSGNRNYFLTPHHPLNERILRFGLNWTFYN